MKTIVAKMLFTSTLMVSLIGNVYGDSSSDEDTSRNSENVIVDSSPLSIEKKQAFQQQRKEEAEETETPFSDDSLQLSGLAIPIKTYLCALASNEYNSTLAGYSQEFYHWLESFPHDTILKLEDGSEWLFDKSDAYIIRSWRTGDTLVLSPTSSYWFWGSNFNYVLTNKQLGTSINVNPFLGPVENGPMTYWIIGLNPQIGEIYIVNGQGERSVWQIPNKDMEYFKDWAVGHTIIIGDNTSWLWWFSSYNSIIINVNMNHYVHAKQISSNPNYKKEATTVPQAA